MALAPNDTVSTIGAGGHRVWLYPLRVMGRYVRMRTAVAWVLVGFLLIAPWIDIAGHPAMFFDIPNRRFYFWGLTLFATDASYLLFLFGVFIFSIFFFTAVFGRLWCGWACPQTVFLESIIRPIEQLIEGPPSARKRLDAAPWTARKIFQKGLKHSAFLVVSGAIATTAVAYFLGRDGVLEAQADPLSHPIGTGFFIALTGLLMFDFAWFREQVCIVACPYGRFQSVLMDADSLTIGYDERRGEPRGKPKARQADGSPLGDCVDCRRCVQVCPTGIDIRKGVQMECVNCTACIDACDGIMDKLGRPRGLIRYASENTLAGKQRRLVRVRVIAYAVGLVGVLIGFATAVTAREPVELALNRVAGAPYAVQPDGRVQNIMRVRISNRGDTPRTFRLEVVSPLDTEVTSPIPEWVVEGNAVRQFPVLIVRPASEETAVPIRLRVIDDRGFGGTVKASFQSPPTTVGGLK